MLVHYVLFSFKEIVFLLPFSELGVCVKILQQQFSKIPLEDSSCNLQYLQKNRLVKYKQNIVVGCFCLIVLLLVVLIRVRTIFPSYYRIGR